MSLNAIKNITEAEETAKSAKADALAEVKRLIEQTEAAGREAIAAALSSAEEGNLNMMREIDVKAGEYSSELESHTDNKRAAMRARAEARFGEAARIIVERIVSG
ncbi:MAG: hypothetical protein LBN00_04085 [Oscillospiraceae bacterium]|jgi:hypothetical protein|nr:hypothetical protein [Oscillospiraceae bacterium]